MKFRIVESNWLIRLRWGAILCQIATIAGVNLGLGIPLPLTSLLSIVALEILLNLFSLTSTFPKLSTRANTVACLMAADILCLTALLYLTGGPSNPFSLLYLVQVPLAVIILGPRWAITLTSLSAICFGGLFLQHLPLAGLSHGMNHAMHANHPPVNEGNMHLHYIGMWVAFCIAAAFILYFTSRIERELQERRSAQAELERKTYRNEKLASLATLAAGTAHELATPLSTIAVLAKELEQGIRSKRNPTEFLEDAQLIRGEVHRCHNILEQMAVDGGQARGDTLNGYAVADIVSDIVSTLPYQDSINLRTHTEHTITAQLPLAAFKRAVTAVIENAKDASSQISTILVEIRQKNQYVEITVNDRGTGIDPLILPRITEPFFSTKPPGKGMGLGLFVVQSVFENLDGYLEITSNNNTGTNVVMGLPLLQATKQGES